MANAQEQAKARAAERKALNDYLARRIPELHRAGYPGRVARIVAEAEFWRRRRRG